MPPKAAPRGPKRGRAPNASPGKRASQPRAPSQQPTEMPQDLNDELSFEDQSTPKVGAAKGLKARQRPPPSSSEAQRAPRPRRRGQPTQTQMQASDMDRDITPIQRKRRRSSDGEEVGNDELADQSVDTPGSSNKGQKRRGRVSDSLQSIAEEEGAADEENQIEETASTRKRKRGQAPRDERSKPQDDEAAEPKKRKRGRPSLEKPKVAPTKTETRWGRDKGKGKGKGKGSEKQQPRPPQQANPGSEPPAAKKSGEHKPKKDQSQAAAAAVTPEPSPVDSQPLRRGRSRLSGGAQPDVDAEASQPPKTKSRKRRPSPTPPSSRPRPTTKKTQRKGRSTLEPEDSGAEADQQPTREADKADAEPPSSQQLKDDGPPSPPRNHYRHISSRPNPISLATIDKDWAPLDASSSIPLATSLLVLAERPVLQRLIKNVKRRDHAAFVLRKVSQAVTRKLKQRFPFPPALNGARKVVTARARTKGSTTTRRTTSAIDPLNQELDYENVLDTVKSLERALDALLHSRRLLESERTTQEAALEREYAELDALEANARSEARGLRDNLTKSHALVPQPLRDEAATVNDSSAGGDAATSTLRLVGNNNKDGSTDSDSDMSAAAGGLFRNLESLGLQGLGAQVASHMESLGANLRPVTGVVPGIVQGTAALRGVLAKHLAREQYEDVVLGTV